MRYRSEIDGLRAVAVLPVILFHASFEWFSGGFIGVDIFFVISGYLITSIILSEKEAGKFSLASFYERRARRILPALFFVVAVCWLLAFLFMVPYELKDFSESVIALTVFASNIWFWRQSGYFDTSTELKPLLHTWSLSVEEQYYVFFPLMILIFWRLGKQKIQIALFFAGIASLILAELCSTRLNMPAPAFYLLPTRGWELIIGALIAFFSFSNKKISTSSLTNELLSLTGLALIAYAIFSFNKNTPHPGFHTLIPTMGTALVILFATADTMAGKLLGSKIPAKIGLVSYSAYLWHQPLFAFARMFSLDEPSRLMLICLAIASILLAYFSWFFIERPFRDKNRISRNVIFAMAAVASLTMATMGIVTRSEVQNDADRKGNSIVSSECENFTKGGGDASCRKYGNGEKKIVIWGDSHADMLSKYDLASINDTYSFYLISHAGCPPIIGVFRSEEISDTTHNCNSTASLLHYAEYAKNLNPHILILTGRWNIYTGGWKKRGKLQDETHFLSDSAQNPTTTAEKSAEIFSQHLAKTIDFFGNQKIILMQQAPDLAQFGPAAKLVRNDIDVPVSDVNDHQNLDDRILESITKSHPNVETFHTRDIFCKNRICRIADGNDTLYSDDNHLSALGVTYLGKALADFLNKQEYAERSEKAPMLARGNSSLGK